MGVHGDLLDAGDDVGGLHPRSVEQVPNAPASAEMPHDPEGRASRGAGLAGGAGQGAHTHVVGETGHLAPTLVGATIFDPDLAVHPIDDRAAGGVDVDLLAGAGVGDSAGSVP